VTVLTDLVGIRKKLTGNSVVPEHVRLKAQNFVDEFNSVVPYRGRETSDLHFGGENLLTQIARFLPRVLEVQAEPAVYRTD
jgi:hypothetical protein